MNKKFKDCDFVDSFNIYLSLNAVNIPSTQIYTIPILGEKNIQYIKVKKVSVVSDQTTTSWITFIKCSEIINSDKLLTSFAVRPGVDDGQNFYENSIKKVSTPFSGVLNLYLTSDTAKVFTGDIVIEIECYA